MMEIERIAPTSQNTLMFSEAAESGAAVQRQIDTHSDNFARIGSYLRNNPPSFAVTVGRGSSDHAGVYARYLFEIMQGVVTSPSGLSVNSLYGSALKAQSALCLAISQSGKSPDLVAAFKSLSESGSYSIALTNADCSPLNKVANETLSLCAGPENSVAATKSYITSLTAIAQLVAHWSNDTKFLDAIEELPTLLNKAWELDWSAAVETFVGATNGFVLGRGVGYSITREAALKFKETCSLHAEAYSSAEVLHGPAALVKTGFPILVFSQKDETQSSVKSTLDTLAKTQCKVFAAGVNHPGVTELPTLEAHPMLQPILMIQSFYRMVNEISIARGYNPDKPPNLNKVTETV